MTATEVQARNDAFFAQQTTKPSAMDQMMDRILTRLKELLHAS